MKPIVAVFPLVMAVSPAAALTVSPGDVAADLAAAMLQAGGGISIEDDSASLIGTGTQQGTFANFNQGPADQRIQIDNGVVLTTGTAEFDTTTNTVNNTSVTADTGGNDALSEILVDAGLPSTTTFDQNVISFLFTVNDPGQTSVFGDFVFASEEFPSQNVTDVMGIFVNGVNFAFFPGGALVSNQGEVTSEFFNLNPVGSALFGMEWNGITNRLTFEAPVQEGVNSFSLAIADTLDPQFDSAVFFSGLRAGQATGGGGGIVPPPDVIPLPAAGWLLLTGLGALGLLRRRGL